MYPEKSENWKGSIECTEQVSDILISTGSSFIEAIEEVHSDQILWIFSVCLCLWGASYWLMWFFEGISFGTSYLSADENVQLS